MHVLEAAAPGGRGLVPEDAQREWLAANIPQMLADAPDDADRLAAMLPPDKRDIVLAAKPARIPVWTALIQTTGVVPAIDKIRYFGARVRAEDGSPLATLYVYGADLPATLLALVAQGDRGMFERMARLADPGRREAAVMFADIQSSGELSRHLSSAAYFRLVQELFTELTGSSTSAAASSASTRATASARSSSARTSAPLLRPRVLRSMPPAP